MTARTRSEVSETIDTDDGRHARAVASILQLYLGYGVFRLRFLEFR